MTDYWEEAETAFLKLFAYSETQAASFITANFVGLMVALVEAKMGQTDDEIVIEGEGENSRNITIHPRKKNDF